MAGKISKWNGNFVEFVKPLEDGHKCTICNFVLLSPFQTDCGHRFCKECVIPVITSTSGSKMCPEDNTVLSIEQIFPDNFCDREIKKLEIFCSNKDQECDWKGPLENLKAHQSECPKHSLACPKGCQEILLRFEMENHFANDCPHADANCPMADQCDFQGSRAQLREHLVDRNVEHTSMIQDKMTAMQSTIEMIQGAQQQQQQDLENQLVNQHEESATLRYDLATLRAAVDRYTMAKEAESMEDMKGRVRKLEERVQNLHLRGRQRREGQSRVNKAVVDLERRVDAMEQQITLRDAHFADHDVMLSMLETTSYDGVFIWRIHDYGRRLNEAMMGKRLFIDSQPFYVGRPGYKVRARAYLNGYGLGERTHLSVFIVVMRSEHDALLPWPFQQKVAFKLIDQSQDQHIINSFRPSLQPNVASGCPLFVPRDALTNGEYTKDNVMFVKITVDTTGIPTY